MIQDSVYLISGGASGLGKATAELLLAEGAKISVLDLQLPAEDSTFKKYEGRVIFLQIDVTSEKEVLNSIDVTKRTFGKLNGVINCAGIAMVSPIYNFKKNEPHSLQEFIKIINVNLIGTFNVIRLAIPLLAENEPNSDGERGIIINTSSFQGHQGIAEGSAYAASKAGVIGMTYPLAKELSGHGIRVVDIAPGFMDTPMLQVSIEQGFKSDDALVFPKRFGKPSEFGNLVKTVIQNPMLNGTSIKLDGAIRL